LATGRNDLGELYQRELASDLTLDDLQGFTQRFLVSHRRQLQRKDPFLEFLVPEVLKPFGLSERYRTATFDRDLAIKRSDAEFLAIGHPFVDAMLAYVGSYDFGGLTAIREIAAPDLASRSGFLFVFVLRQRVTREDGDECLFQFAPVFATVDGCIDEAALTPAVTQVATDAPASTSPPPDPAKAFHAAKQYLEQETTLWDWADDVEFLGLSWVEFK
jgi:RNA polymerase recycling family C-terminal